MIRLLIADDHGIVRQGLRMLMSLDEDLDVLPEEAADGREAVRLVRELAPDVVLMDVLMPVMDGITATGIIHRENPEVQVIALTSVLERSGDDGVVDAVRAGAAGYLLKTTDAQDVRNAVHAVAEGQVQLSPAAVGRLVQAVTSSPSDESLTDREVQVLVRLANGMANKEIARDMGIGQETVKTYVSNILAKLGVRTRTQAALHAVRAGLLTPEQLTDTLDSNDLR